MVSDCVGKCDCTRRHHWRLEGEPPHDAYYFRAGQDGCTHPAHRYDTAYWGICHNPAAAAGKSDRENARSPGAWFWFLGYRDEPSAFWWFESEADALAEGDRIVALQTPTSTPLARCDLVASDYLELGAEGEERRARNNREYQEWKAEQAAEVLF